MLLTSVILVLREVLEAALLISLLLALSQRLGRSGSWVVIALIIGLLGAAIYGFNIDYVSGWFDGVGQEVGNALLQLAIYVLLCLLVIFTVRRNYLAPESGYFLTVLLALPVTLALVREGSEIMIYLYGFLQLPEQQTSVLAGSSIGAGIGLSVGAVFYYTLRNLPRRAAKLTGGALLVLVAGGMVAQATQLLIQADWLPAQYPIWDSSWLINEQSVTGQLLYALIGYESTPTAVQVSAYLGSIALILLLVWASLRSVRHSHA